MSFQKTWMITPLAENLRRIIREKGQVSTIDVNFVELDAIATGVMNEDLAINAFDFRSKAILQTFSV
jgi:replicative DNA helicase